MTYRLAETSDAKLYFDWANDPEVRKQSHNTDPITWENHVKWFNKNLNASLIFIFFDGEPVGQVRLTDNCIDVSVDLKHRRKGLATQMLKTLKEILIKTRYPDLSKVVGEVKKENTGSIKAFEKAGYKLDSVTNVNGVECNLYVIYPIQ